MVEDRESKINVQGRFYIDEFETFEIGHSHRKETLTLSFGLEERRRERNLMSVFAAKATRGDLEREGEVFRRIDESKRRIL